MNFAREITKNVIKSCYIQSASMKKEEEHKIYLYASINFQTVLQSVVFDLTENHYFMLSYHQKLVKVDIQRIFWTMNEQKFIGLTGAVVQENICFIIVRSNVVYWF